MKYADSLYKLRKTISEKGFHISNETLNNLRIRCVDDKKFTYAEIVGITAGNIPIESLSEQQLFWLLEYSGEYIKGLGKAEDYFTNFEIQSYKYYKSEELQKKIYPITFHNVTPMTLELGSDCRQFSFYLTVEDIMKYKEDLIFQVKPELQRDGRRNRYDHLKTKVNPKRIREIAKLIENGEFFYNSISLNLMDDDEARWFYNGNDIVIEKGTLIILDGNHRALACEIVERNNVHKHDLFNILLTILSPEYAKRKISQEWNTETVNKTQQRYMQPTAANSIVDAIKRNADLDDIIKENIVTTGYQVNYGEGFIIYSILSDAIEKYYNTKDIISKYEQQKIVRWLVEFFNVIAHIFHKDFSNFNKIKKNKWNVSPYAFVGFVFLSHYLMNNQDWEKELLFILDKIDFTATDEFNKIKREKAYIAYVENTFSEVLRNGKE